MSWVLSVYIWTPLIESKTRLTAFPAPSLAIKLSMVMVVLTLVLRGSYRMGSFKEALLRGQEDDEKAEHPAGCEPETLDY